MDRQTVGRRFSAGSARAWWAAAVVLVLVAVLVPPAPASGQVDPCAPLTNPVACENSLPGNPAGEWDISGAGSDSIQGFATDISVDQGGTVRFKVDTPADDYRLDIYRMGYYGGDGARLIATVQPSATLPQSQPTCLEDSDTGLIDCGNWAESAAWQVPPGAVSGIYFAKLVREDGTNGASHIVFIVRDDDGGSDLLFQTADTTWQAYNEYGGNSLYTGSPAGRAYKVSYNRPFTTRDCCNEDWVFNAEYPMVRWLERNGYDVSYFTDVDTDRRGAELLEHEVFLSVGHDEYWSADQRANVEAARDAGVDLAFFSGNEVFWKTRWESSIDGSGTSHRTLVSYKETKDDAKIDPSPEWTGTWRDPRFSPPADGGRPENALTGTIFTVNGVRADPMRVPAADGRMRFWRDTDIATLGANQTATLPDGVLGYEWDEDLDNGHRPPGLIRLSSTTIDDAPVLQDHGSSYAPATATHHLTLYRHASGALVFGAGTVQWSWGLDDNHDRGAGTPTDARMQQATVNLLADMGVQPATLQSGLVAATASTDTTAPTATIASPADGAAVPPNADVTVAGSATDSGGRVGGVEVSTDDGATWHPADGREDWTYRWTTPSTGGDVTVRVRAVDDSGNIQTPAATVAVNVGGRPDGCPCSVWGPLATPTVGSEADASAVELGMRFRPSTDGVVTGVRFYKGPANTGTHTGTLWNATGAELATVTFTDETATGWQQADFATPVPVTAGTTYVVSYHAPDGGYAVDAAYFATTGVDAGPLRALADGEDGPNGVYRYGGRAFPANSYNATNYWVDVVFDDTQGGGGPDTDPPTILGRTPADASAGVPVTVDPTATFSEPVQAASVTFTLEGPGGGPVAAAVGYDGASRTATLTPDADLAAGVTYTATVSGATDAAGNTMATDTWTFTTAEPQPVTCPCGVWSDATTPSVASEDDSSPVELGMRFRAATDGYVRGVRFYKGAGNTGTHVGSLWRNDGTRLAQVTFSDETASGWQEARFTRPVAITADTTYVVSYFAPNGGYAVDAAFFTADVVSGDLRALADGGDGPNGVYRYNEAGFPESTYQSSNYWVDVVFDADGTDTNPPQLEGRAPADGATDVPTDTTVAATFSEPIDEATLDLVVTGPSGVVPGAVTYDAQTYAATFTPDATLATDASFTVALTAADTAGNAMPTDTWSFTTGGAQQPPGTCPCTIFSPTTTPTTTSESDPSAVEVGVRFRPDTDGFVSGVRFYKGAGNTGTHVGTLWTAGGQELASVTFTGESSSGWQQAQFASPVAVTAGTTYVASYHAPNGGYAVDADAFAGGVTNGPLEALADGDGGPNGLYRYGARGFPTSSYRASNYWVDVVFEADPSPNPRVIGRTPQPAAGNVALDATVTARFDRAIDEATLQFTLTDGSGQPVAGAVTYDASTRTATLTPDAELAPDTAHTAGVQAADPAGNAMPAPDTWSFVTRRPPGVCPCSLFDSAAVPTIEANDDGSAVEVGMRFRAEADGFVTGVRFYKGPGNTGTHVGTLWTDAGQELAAVVFSGESAAGWQQAQFTAPVQIAADTTYVISYHAPAGRYALDEGFFAGEVDTPPLRGLADGASGAPNGVYRYGARGFPTSTFAASNYWVDVVFEYTATDTIAPAINARTPAEGASDVPISSDVSVTFSEAIDETTLDLELEAGDATPVPAVVTYDQATRTATLAPDADLDVTSTYTARVAATDPAGNTLQQTSWQFTTGGPPPPPPHLGPGGPIAVVGSADEPFGRYSAEILRTEGLNAFETITPGDLTAPTLAAFDVVVLGETAVTPAAVTALTDWVTAGGNLIALRPDAALYPLLGLTGPSSTLADGYLRVDTSAAPGAGIVGQTMQFHGTADVVTAADAEVVATLYADATTATPNPAVTMRSVGTAGGQAVAFTFDLARSVVLTRQGNPAWAGQERDGYAPIRSDDQFFGGSETDWVDLDKVAIPQADEQQRLLANVIEHVNGDRMPLPRFWYFPRFEKAVVVATGDDHGNNGTQGRFDKYAANSPGNCAVDDWACLRFSSYIYPSTPLDPGAARDYDAAGFEVGLHVSTGCADYTPESLRTDFADQLSEFAGRYADVAAPRTNRTHCIAWSDWATQPVVSLEHGIRFDTNYYYWPATWVDDRPGFMTGSGMPMRFAQSDGTMIDVYQAATQMTDESGQSYPYTPDTLLDRALGAEGYYGAFVTNLHTDLRADSDLYDDLTIASAQSRGVPIVSSRQMLTWLDGRNASSFQALAWDSGTLRFDVIAGQGANGLTALLPMDGPSGRLDSLRRDGAPVSWTTETIKGVEYARFAAVAGAHEATYGASTAAATNTVALGGLELAAAEDDTAPPRIDAVEATALPNGTVTLRWHAGDASDTRVRFGTGAGRLTSTAIPSSSGGRASVVLADLEPETTYHYRLESTDEAGNRTTWPAPPRRPARVRTTAAGVADLTAVGFRTGALGAGGQIARSDHGELELASDVVEEFDAPGRTGAFRRSGARTRVLGGEATVDGGRLTTGRALAPGEPVEFTAELATGARQEIGLVGGRRRAVFRVADGRLHAVTVGRRGTPRRTDVSAHLVDGPQTFVVERGRRAVHYRIDGEVVATHRVAVAGRLRIQASDSGAGDDRDLTVARVAGGERADRARFTSRVLDAAAMVRWRRLVLDADVPDGTALRVRVRTGDTAAPDATWTSFRDVTSGRVGGRSRYLQYRLELTTDDPARTPVVHGVGFTHDGDLPGFPGETGGDVPARPPAAERPAPGGR